MKKWTVVLLFGSAATFAFLRVNPAPDDGDKGAGTPAQGPFTYLANAFDYIASKKKAGSCMQKPAFMRGFFGEFFPRHRILSAARHNVPGP